MSLSSFAITLVTLSVLGSFAKIYPLWLANLCCKYEFQKIVIFSGLVLGVFLLKGLLYMFTSKFLSLVYSLQVPPPPIKYLERCVKPVAPH